MVELVAESYKETREGAHELEIVEQPALMVQRDIAIDRRSWYWARK